MRGNKSRALSLILLCLPVCLYAQNWYGILDSSRAITWNPGVNGGIPANYTQCGSTIAAYSGTATTINNAIAACGAQTYVLLGAGTFNLSTGILIQGHSNVALRGVGPDKTFLVFSGYQGCLGTPSADICVENASGINPASPPHTANWTAGLSAGSTSITLDNTSGLSPGMILYLDQLDDSNTDNGNLWVCETVNVCSTEGPVGIARTGRGQVQTAVVTSVNSGTGGVGIYNPIYMPNWSSGKTPQAWWIGDQISGVGIENLSVDHSGTAAAAGIVFGNARDCWVKNYRSLWSNRAHVWMFGATRIILRDSYFYGTQSTGGVQSYGFENDLTSDSLFENNIFQTITSPFVGGTGTEGNVFGYNFSINDYMTNPSDWLSSSAFHHDIGNTYTLYEGNDGIGFTGDAIHGTSHFMTAFRNRWIGWKTGTTNNTNVVQISSFNRYFNFIGNVVGKYGYHTTYECAAQTTGDSCTADGNSGVWTIYTWGYANHNGPLNIRNDPFVKTSMMRWGNYDTVNSAVRWQAAEVPSSLSLYANPVPASQTLPGSFYLSNKPQWFSSTPWPAIGPDVTGGNLPGAGGHANLIPAGNCYLNVMSGPSDGSGGVLTFNANNCYNDPPLPPPTSLTVVVH